ncbi:MAG: proton-conducting membrane transporter [Sandaracinaceae bacterium]|nr:proton-conducting membrane transporter [Sandaracinaceae bacterium]
MPDESLRWVVLAIPGAPALAFVLLGVTMLLFRAPSERTTTWIVVGSLGVSFLLTATVFAVILATGRIEAEIVAGNWFLVGDYGFTVAFLLDPLSVGMMMLTSVVTALIGRFSVAYLHREKGYPRFFLLLSLFAAGMLVLVMGASIDLLFVGWELVGLTSALLVAFFQERRAPVEGALRVFITYRLCDLGLLAGAVLLHQASGTSNFYLAFLAIRSHEDLGVMAATILPLALLLAAMGKSAQFPVGGWLPRAMEGPTPSSALFYGALSVHAGVYLLLRAAPLFEASPIAKGALIWVGVSTALYATLVSRVQADVKTQLAYATMTQVGLMLVEIGLGYTTLATLHMLAHGALRGFQLLRAPSALRDAEELRIAGMAMRREGFWSRVLPASVLQTIYRMAFSRFHIDTMHERFVIGPVLALARALDALDRKWIEVLSGWGHNGRERRPVEPSVLAERGRRRP